jgi:hypothetical protein
LDAKALFSSPPLFPGRLPDPGLARPGDVQFDELPIRDKRSCCDYLDPSRRLALPDNAMSVT